MESDHFVSVTSQLGAESRAAYPGSLLVLQRFYFHKVTKRPLSFSDSDYCIDIQTLLSGQMALFTHYLSDKFVFIIHCRSALRTAHMVSHVSY